jgi:Tfp pilus assembly protein PilO
MTEEVLEQNEDQAVKIPPPVVRKAQPKQGMFGIPEIIALAFSGLLVLSAAVSYFYFLLPAQLRLKTLNDEKAQLEKSIKPLQGKVDEDKTSQQNIADIVDSVANFERTHLRQRSTGRVSLYQELNEAIRRNGLINTDGPTYTALDPINPNAPKTQANKAGIARWQSLFPGISISITVEGSYANLRRFIRDIESNSQFVIINAVQLEGQDKSNLSEETNPNVFSGNPTNQSQPSGQKKSGRTVSLRLDMAIYFQRGVQAPEQATEQAKS